MEKVDTLLGEISVQRMIGKGKSGYSFLAELNGAQVVFKRMHDEPCPYYNFSNDKVSLEVGAYEMLKKVGIPVPELLGFDVERQYLLKVFIDGKSGHEWLAQGGQDESIIEQLFAMAGKLRAHDLNIDYFPANFVITQGNVYYVDYEINRYSDEWSLGQWGVYYWANRAGMAEYARSGDWRGINESADSGKPIKEPFEDQVNAWRKMFQE